MRTFQIQVVAAVEAEETIMAVPIRGFGYGYLAPVATALTSQSAIYLGSLPAVYTCAKRKALPLPASTKGTFQVM
jgi:hypothetical protein